MWINFEKEEKKGEGKQEAPEDASTVQGYLFMHGWRGRWIGCLRCVRNDKNNEIGTMYHMYSNSPRYIQAGDRDGDTRRNQDDYKLY